MDEKKFENQETENEGMLITDNNMEDQSDEITVEPLPLYDEENQFTEVLDFSHLNDEMVNVENQEEIASIENEEDVKDEIEVVPILENQENIENEYIDNQNDEVKFEQVEPSSFRIGAEETYEHPSAKIVLNSGLEDVTKEVDVKDLKVNLKDNKSLIFVIFLGILLLIVTFFLPYFI